MPSVATQTLQDLKKSAQRYPLATALLGLPILVTVVTFAEKFFKFKAGIEWLVQKGVHAKPAAELDAAWWFEAILLLVFAGLVILIWMYWTTRSYFIESHSQLEAVNSQLDAAKSALDTSKSDVDDLRNRLNQAQADVAKTKAIQDERRSAAIRTLEGMVSAVSQVRKQLLPASGQQFNVFQTVKSRYFISKDFSASVIREYRIKASERPIHFWVINIIAEPEATPADYLIVSISK